MHADNTSGQASHQSISQFLEKKDQIVQACLRLIDQIADFCLSNETKRGESVEDINKKMALNKQKKNKFKSYMAANQKGGQQQADKEDEDDQESQEFLLMKQVLKSFADQNQIVTNVFKFMHVTTAGSATAALAVASYPNLKELLQKATISVENANMRAEVLKRVREVVRGRLGTPEAEKVLRVVSTLAFEIKPNSQSGRDNRSLQYYDGLTGILEILSKEDIGHLREPFHQMIKETAQFVYQREIVERNTNDIDYLLAGRMKILRVLLQKFPELKQDVGEALTHHLIHHCLFEVSHGGASISSRQGRPPKCKSALARQNALNLLGVLCRDCPANLHKVLSYLSEFNHNPSWRTHKDFDWNISLMESEKSSTGYVGLKNLGCICYMNSLFQ